MRRTALVMLLSVTVLMASACAQPTAAQQALREIHAKPGEPVRSPLESRGPTSLDSRILAAIDRRKPVKVEARSLAGSSASAAGQMTGSEAVAYVFSDGSELLVRSAVDSSGLRVMVAITAQ